MGEYVANEALIKTSKLTSGAEIHPRLTSTRGLDSECGQKSSDSDGVFLYRAGLRLRLWQRPFSGGVMGLLVLMRHAKSDYPLGVPDHERPLAKRGRREAPLMAPLLDLELADSQTVVVLVSDAVRTQQTWACVSEAWERVVSVENAPEIYEASVSAITDRIHRVGTADAVVVVGHNPGLEDLVGSLVGNQALERFPTSALAVLECDDEWATFDRGLVRLKSFYIAR